MIKLVIKYVKWKTETEFYQLSHFRNQFNNPLLEPIFILKVWDFAKSEGQVFECNDLKELSQMMEFLND